MIKMILTVPHGFNAETFGNVATSMVRDSQNEFDRRDYDYNLGDFLSVHCAKDDSNWITFNYYDLKGMDTYEVNADYVDMEHIAALMKLQKICPQVEFHFENSGNGKNDTRYFGCNDSCKDFFEEYLKH